MLASCPDFRRVWIAGLGSYLGNWFEFVGTQWLVTEATGSLLWASTLGAAQLLPTLVLGMVGGVVADRVNRRTLLLVTQGAMMLVAIGFALLTILHLATPTSLILLALAQGVAIAFNVPANSVLLPRLVPRERLVEAITLQGISFNAARAVGPALAGIVMAFWGPAWLFGINALSFVGILLAVWKTPDAPAPPNADGGWYSLRSLWRDTRDAGAFVLLRPGPRAAFLAGALFACLGTPIMRFLSLFVQRVYHLEERTFGILAGLMGAGAVTGGLALKLVPAWYPKHHFIPLSMTLGALSILAFSACTNPYAAGVAIFFVGIFWLWTFNAASAALQLLVDDSMRGRALAISSTIGLGLMPAGYYLSTWLGGLGSHLAAHLAPPRLHDGLPTQIGVGACAAILLACSLAMLRWRTPELDQPSPDSPTPARIPGLFRGITASAHRPRPGSPSAP